MDLHVVLQGAGRHKTAATHGAVLSLHPLARLGSQGQGQARREDHAWGVWEEGAFTLTEHLEQI